MRIFFVGASGHGKVCAEIAELTGYDTILFLDDNKELTGCGGHRVIGVEDDFRKFVDSTTDFFISIGNCKVRQRIQERIKSSGGEYCYISSSGSNCEQGCGAWCRHSNNGRSSH